MLMPNLNLSRVKQSRVLVLMGGTSAEREVSLKSGTAVLNALLREHIDAVSVDTGADDFLEQIISANADVVFIALHGVGGEDGTIQGLLESLNIPYTGSDVLGSALAMDKLKTKLLWRSSNLPTANFDVLNEHVEFSKVLSDLSGKVIVKPVTEGSSIGMNIATSEQQLVEAYKEASLFNCEVMAEQWNDGEEYTVAIVGNQALPVIKLKANADFYDYEAKYAANDTQYLCPCGLSEEKEKELQALSLKAFNSLGCKGWGRVDVMTDSLGNWNLLEVNTSPGMTNHSLVPMAAKAMGVSFDDLVLSILAVALDDHAPVLNKSTAAGEKHNG